MRAICCCSATVALDEYLNHGDSSGRTKPVFYRALLRKAEKLICLKSVLRVPPFALRTRSGWGTLACASFTKISKRRVGHPSERKPRSPGTPLRERMGHPRLCQFREEFSKGRMGHPSILTFWRRYRVREFFKRTRSNKNEPFTIKAVAKRRILQELDQLNVNERTVFPNLESSAAYLNPGIQCFARMMRISSLAGGFLQAC